MKARVRNDKPLGKKTSTINYNSKLPSLPCSKYINNSSKCITYPSSYNIPSTMIELNECTFVARKYYVMDSKVLTALSS